MENNQIKHIEVNLGKICNNRCIFCMAKNNDAVEFGKDEEIKKEIDYYSKKGFNSIGFLGGEPTIHPDIVSIVSYAKKKNFKKIHIVSNGRRYSSLPFLKALIAAGVTRFSVSIHSHIPEIEDSLTRAKGGFNQKIKGLKNLVKLRRLEIIKDNISINIVLNKENYKRIIESLSFFKGLGLSEFRLNFIRPEGRALYNFKRLVPRYSDFAKYIPAILNFTEKEKVSISIGDMPYCMFPNVKNPDDFSGQLSDYFDLVVSFGNNNREGIPLKQEFSWRKSRRNDLKVKRKTCLNCIYNPSCEGPWKNYVKKLGFEEFKPVKK